MGQQPKFGKQDVDETALNEVRLRNCAGISEMQKGRAMRSLCSLTDTGSLSRSTTERY